MTLAIRFAILALPLMLLPAYATAADQTVRIVIDPGHGGHNMGAVGPYGVHEKYVTLSIADKLVERLTREKGVVVFVTRKDDVFVSLKDRAEMANALEADMFLSIHCNAAQNTEANGIETFYLGPGSDSTIELAGRENGTEAATTGQAPDQSLYTLLADMQFNGSQNESAILAAEIQKSLVSTFREARNREVRQAPFTVLETARMPAVVIETGFITHREEGKKLLMADHQTRIADAIHKAVMEFIRQNDSKPAFARQVELE